MILQTTLQEVGMLVVRLGGLAVLAGLIAGGCAGLYRWYVDEELPQGVALLIGAGAIAVVLNTTAALGQSIGGTTDLLAPRAAGYTVLAFLLGGMASEGGRLVGDRFGQRFVPDWRVGGIDRDLSAFVKGGGRTVRVKLPEDIRDIDGYEPVRPELKDTIAGQTLTFPGRLTIAEVHDAIVARLQRDAGVAKVDVEFDEEGKVVYLAVGRGEAGIGHTLAPDQVAIAIRADPAFAASQGDLVRIWRVDPSPERLLTGELRGVVGDVVTIAVPADAVDMLATEADYRLVTLPESPMPAREFAGILRRANESVRDVVIEASSTLVDRTVGELEATVLAVTTADGAVHALPDATLGLDAGDRIMAIGRPDRLRRLEARAQGTS